MNFDNFENMIENYLKNEEQEQVREIDHLDYVDYPSDEDNCCDDEGNIILSENLNIYVCCECGTVSNKTPHNVDFYDKFKNPNFVKSFIPYSNKYRHLYRLNKWSNYSYSEVQMDKLLKEIDRKMENFDSELTSFTKMNFKNIYSKISIRAKIKDGLIVYCIYKSSLMLKRDIDIDVLLKLMNVSIKNYNDLNKKLKDDKLFYLDTMNEYLELTDNKIIKKDLIRYYNNFLILNKRKFNNKSILLGIIFFILKQDKEFDKKEFFNIFNISKSSIKNVGKFIVSNDIIN